MKYKYREELQKELRACFNTLDVQQERYALENFETLIFQTWEEFNISKGISFQQEYKLTEPQLADFYLTIDKKFEEYVDQLL